MKTWSILLVVLCVAVGVAGCSGGKDVSSAPAAEKKADPPAPAPAVAITPAPAPAETPAAAPTEATPSAAATGLEGTSWKVGDFTIAFKDGSTINVKGGPLGEGEGVPGTYTLADGQVTISAVGQTKNGTWDGTTLAIDGNPAQKL